MVMYTVFFTLANLLIAAWWCCTCNLQRKARIFGLLLIGNFFIYSGMSNVIFSTFPCVDYDYGDERGTRRLLRADLGIDCDSSAHQLAVSWAGLMAIAFPLGVPAGYWLLLRWYKVAIMADDRKNNASLDPIRFLFANYSPNAWYFEPIVCVQKLILVGVVVFFWPGTLTQLGITEAGASVFLAVYAYIQPFGKASINLHGMSAQVSSWVGACRRRLFPSRPAHLPSPPTHSSASCGSCSPSSSSRRPRRPRRPPLGPTRTTRRASCRTFSSG